MEQTYYIYSNNTTYGPFTAEKINAGLKSGAISYFDLIHDREKNSWMMIMQHPDFAVSNAEDADPDQDWYHTRSQADEGGEDDAVGLTPSDFSADESLEKQLAFPNFVKENPVVNKVIKTSDIVSWYEQNEKDKPLRYLDVIQKLISREFNEHTIIAKNLAGPWWPINQWPQFGPESIAEFKKQNVIEIPDTIVRRRNERRHCGKTYLFINGTTSYFKAYCPELSQTGLSFITDAPMFNVNDITFIKFDSEFGEGNFDARAEVVGCHKITVNESGTTMYRHSLRFLQLASTGKKYLFDFFDDDDKTEAAS